MINLFGRRLINDIISRHKENNPDISQLIKSISEKSEKELKEEWAASSLSKALAVQLFSKPYLNTRNLAAGIKDAENTKEFKAYFKKIRRTAELILNISKKIKKSNGAIISDLGILNKKIALLKETAGNKDYEYFAKVCKRIHNIRISLNNFLDGIINASFRTIKLSKQAYNAGEKFNYGKLIGKLEEERKSFYALLNNLGKVYRIEAAEMTLEEFLGSVKEIKGRASISSLVSNDYELRKIRENNSTKSKVLKATAAVLISVYTMLGVGCGSLPPPKAEPVSANYTTQEDKEEWSPEELSSPFSAVVGELGRRMRSLPSPNPYNVYVGEVFELPYDELSNLLKNYGLKDIKLYGEWHYLKNGGGRLEENADGIYREITPKSLIYYEPNKLESGRYREIPLIIFTDEGRQFELKIILRILDPNESLPEDSKEPPDLFNHIDRIG